MKKDFRTIKNIILLIASALTLVAVTFSWFSLSKVAGNFTLNPNVSGSTLSVKYYESKDNGVNYTKLDGDLAMDNMSQGQVAHYRMDVKTYKDALIKLVMSFDGLTNSNTTAKYVYFDYKVVCKATGDVIGNGEKCKMSDYTSSNVFACDLSAHQKNGYYDFYVYYDVYIISDGTDISGSASLGEVKLTGQQVG